jgi:hypothetical protein
VHEPLFGVAFMLELLSKIDPDALAAVIIMTAGLAFAALVGLTSLISVNLRRYHERQLATSLILEMLDRGMTTDDIVRVLSAAGMHDQQEEIFSLRQRLRQKLTRLVGDPAKPAAKP